MLVLLGDPTALKTAPSCPLYSASRLLTCPMQSNLKRLKLSYGLLRNIQLYDLQCLVNAILGWHPESDTAAHMHANAYSEPVKFSVTAQPDKSL